MIKQTVAFTFSSFLFITFRFIIFEWPNRNTRAHYKHSSFVILKHLFFVLQLIEDQREDGVALIEHLTES
jgi:hypothetical protein